MPRSQKQLLIGLALTFCHLPTIQPESCVESLAGAPPPSDKQQQGRGETTKTRRRPFLPERRPDNSEVQRDQSPASCLLARVPMRGIAPQHTLTIQFGIRQWRPVVLTLASVRACCSKGIPQRNVQPHPSSSSSFSTSRFIASSTDNGSVFSSVCFLLLLSFCLYQPFSGFFLFLTEKKKT